MLVWRIKTPLKQNHKRRNSNSNCNNSKTQIVTKIKNSNCEKTQNSNCDKTKKPKLWQHSQTQIVLKHKKHKLWQFKSSNYNKSQIMTKFKKLKLLQNSSTQIGGGGEIKMRQNSICIKTQISNCYKAQTMTNLNLWGENIKRVF